MCYNLPVDVVVETVVILEVTAELTPVPKTKFEVVGIAVPKFAVGIVEEVVEVTFAEGNVNPVLDVWGVEDAVVPNPEAFDDPKVPKVLKDVFTDGTPNVKPVEATEVVAGGLTPKPVLKAGAPGWAPIKFEVPAVPNDGAVFVVAALVTVLENPVEACSGGLKGFRKY